jgi:hypothetical protein
MCRLADVKVLAWGYKFSREIARRMPYFRGEPAPLHPAFAPGSPASVVAHAEGPVAFDTPRIVYSEEDERALDAYVRKMGAPGFPYVFFCLSTLMKIPSLPLLSEHMLAFGELQSHLVSFFMRARVGVSC